VCRVTSSQLAMGFAPAPRHETKARGQQQEGRALVKRILLR